MVTDPIIKTRGTPTARADYLCSACYDSGTMTEPVTLPVLSKVCPICAAPTLERIWTPPHVSTGVAKDVDARMEAGYIQQQRARDTGRAMQRQAPSFAVPMHQLAGVIGQPIGNLRGPASRPTPTVTVPTLAGPLRDGMRKGPKPNVVGNYTPEPKG